MRMDDYDRYEAEYCDEDCAGDECCNGEMSFREFDTEELLSIERKLIEAHSRKEAATMELDAANKQITSIKNMFKRRVRPGESVWMERYDAYVFTGIQYEYTHHVRDRIKASGAIIKEIEALKKEEVRIGAARPRQVASRLYLVEKGSRGICDHMTGLPWKWNELNMLHNMHQEGCTIEHIVQKLSRSESSVRFRIKYLEEMAVSHRRSYHDMGVHVERGDEVSMIRDEYQGNVPLEEIVRRYGRSGQEVSMILLCDEYGEL